MPISIPQLLIGKYDSIDGLKDRICNSTFKPLDASTPTCRFRGTVIKPRDADGAVTVIGWQRNAARLQKMDVSLPSIITAQVRKCPDQNTYRVVSIELDKCFKGSKGVLCSAHYLDRNMKEAVTGRAFDSSLIKKAKLKAMHCFHIVEVLDGMISYFEAVRAELSPNNSRSLFFEEENLDYMTDRDKRSHFCGHHLITGKNAIQYRLTFKDLIEKVSFSKEGEMACNGNLNYEFSIEGRQAMCGEIAFTTKDLFYLRFQKMLLQCGTMVQSAFGFDLRDNMYFTNLHPAAFIGLMTQTLAIRHFGNNYHYIMHALTGLQRRSNAPLCIGSVTNRIETKRFFPGFLSDDLKG